MKPEKREYDAVVVGSGPNGLAAAILMQQKGLSVLLIEGKETIGGGMRSAELTLPGYLHDICSAIHPLAVSSPFFKTLPLAEHGLEFIYPDIAAAHPFDDGSAAILKHPIEETASQFGTDQQAYIDLIQPVVNDWPSIALDVLGPLHFPKHPIAMARFGLKALRSASSVANSFKTEKAKGLFGGMAAHCMQTLTNLSSAATALVLMVYLR
jgi:phytoene dehydrogenase-like protein